MYCSLLQPAGASQGAGTERCVMSLLFLTTYMSLSIYKFPYGAHVLREEKGGLPVSGLAMMLCHSLLVIVHH